MKMLERHCVRDQRKIASAITQHYHRDLFCDMHFFEQVNGANGPKSAHAVFLRDPCKQEPDTAFYIPAGLLLNGDGRYISSLDGIESNLLKRSLWIPPDADGDLRFMLGRCEVRVLDGDDSRRMRFDVVDGPQEMHLADSMLSVRKLSNNDSEKETVSGWEKKVHICHVDKAFYYQRTTETFDGFYWEFRIYPLGFRFIHPEKGKYCWTEHHQYYNTFSEFLSRHGEAVRELYAHILRERKSGTPATSEE